MKNCNECVFGIHWGFDKSGMPTIQICHAKNMSNEEAAERIKSKEECDMYPEGHELYKRYKNGEFSCLTASQKHLIDKKDFSEQPTAICGHIRIGMEACYRGEGQYCYCRLGCTSKTELDGSGKMLKEERKMLGGAISKAIAKQNEVI